MNKYQLRELAFENAVAQASTLTTGELLNKSDEAANEAYRRRQNLLKAHNKAFPIKGYCHK